MKQFLATFLLSATAIYVSAQEIVINPTPRQMEQIGENLPLPASFCVKGSDEAASNAVKVLNGLLDTRMDGKGLELCIGEKGDKSVQKYSKQIPDHPEGYYLEIGKKKIVLAGNDERGTFYAVQTFKQLIADDKGNMRAEMPYVRITDYPDVAVRGIVEGFYGSPWKQEARESQLDFYGRYKLNTYIFGPKNDPYHSTPKWRLPYPEKQAKGIRELVQRAHENEVDFVWAIHPGRDIQWNDEDRDKVMEKFEHMYGLGVRSFAVFFDDISGNGTNANRQVELMNYLNAHFVRVKKDVKPLIVCPTQYNRSRYKPETNYLETLGSELDEDIRIMWTGNFALSDITADNLQWIQGLLKRKPYIWWNFPVTDFADERILMGKVQGVDSMIASNTSGFVSNPMEFAEASKVALYGVADMTWNTHAFNPDRAWLAAIRLAMPDSPEAFHHFCSNASATGVDHFMREESEYLIPLLKRLENDYVKGGNYHQKDFDEMKKEFVKMTESASQLLADTSNLPLKREIHPWFVNFALIGEMGQNVLRMVEALECSDKGSFEIAYSRVVFLQRNIQALHRRASVGNAHVLPFIRLFFATATKRFNTCFQTSWEESMENIK